MKTRTLIAFGLIGAFATTLPGISSADEKKRPKTSRLPEKIYDLSSGGVSGDRARGPRRLVATNLNTLRYDYSMGRVISFTGPGDLWSNLLSATVAPQKTDPGGAATGAPAEDRAPESREELERKCREQDKSHKQVPEDVKVIYCEAESLATFIRQKSARINEYAGSAKAHRIALKGFLDQVQKGIGELTRAGRQLKDTLQANASVPVGILENIAALLRDTPPSPFMIGTKVEWVDGNKVRALRTSAENLKKELLEEAGQFPRFLSEQSGAVAALNGRLSARVAALKRDTSVGSVQALERAIKNLEGATNDLVAASRLLEWASEENEAILAAIPELEDGSAKQTAFVEARDGLLDWKARMENLKARWDKYEKNAAANPFSVEADGDCEFAFGGTKTTNVTITRVDRLPGSNTAPEQILSVTIECTSPFTVSAGAAFSTVVQQEFAIRSVPGASGGPAEDRFVTTSKSNVHPVPLGMLHARFYEPNEAFALHASFGLAGNLRSQGAGGSDAEFILGVSFSLFRTMFITPGVYLGRRVDLSSGFKEGGVAPTGMTEPPLRKSYQARIGLAITFTKP